MGRSLDAFVERNRKRVHEVARKPPTYNGYYTTYYILYIARVGGSKADHRTKGLNQLAGG